tara:strand:+ start:2712 stop:3140 length:429 start_codon:yes stop_codon:yes gene_type:complete
MDDRLNPHRDAENKRFRSAAAERFEDGPDSKKARKIASLQQIILNQLPGDAERDLGSFERRIIGEIRSQNRPDVLAPWTRRLGYNVQDMDTGEDEFVQTGVSNRDGTGGVVYMPNFNPDGTERTTFTTRDGYSYDSNRCMIS